VSGVNWQPTTKSDAFDVALAALLSASAATSLYMGGDPFLAADLADYPRATGIVLTALMVAPLAVRRRFPAIVVAIVTAAFVPLRIVDIPEFTVSAVALFIAIYTVGAYGDRGRTPVRVAVVLTILALLAWVLAAESDSYGGRVSLVVVNAFGATQNIFYLAAAWVLGDLVRNRREREATLLRQAEALTEAQRAHADQAVVSERVRIARELHDVVAHHVSLMGVQAGAARRVLVSRPEAVPDLLASVEDSSRQAVQELQAMLGLLRRDDTADTPGRRGTHRVAGDVAGDAGPHAGDAAEPQPTLARLDDLVAQMRDAGLVVDVRVDGPLDDLAPAVGLSAYRIAQEALTNTLKHAGADARVRLTVTRRTSALELCVTDDGPVDPDSEPSPAADDVAAWPDGPGLGIVGMHERATLLGGELHTGPRPDGGSEVRAWLPLRTAPGAPEARPEVATGAAAGPA
jgi:signal transduction histidine kinase